MTSQQRIRLARSHAGLSQAALATAVGVQRSAVSHWEANNGKHPSVTHMREMAMACGVQFEWLATGRGKMSLSEDTALDSVRQRFGAESVTRATQLGRSPGLIVPQLPD